MSDNLLQKHTKFAETAEKTVKNIKLLAIGNASENDVDCILVAPKIRNVAELKKKAEEIYGCRVSISFMTPMMFERKIFSTKVAVMLHKGVHCLLYDENMEAGWMAVGWDDVRQIAKGSSIEFVNTILKKLVDGKIDKDKAIELLAQQVVLLSK